MIKGKPLPPVKDIAPPSEQELDELAALWDATVDAKYKGLLDAQPLGTPNATARFLYDRANMRYIDRATGRILTRQEVKAAFNQFVNGRK